MQNLPPGVGDGSSWLSFVTALQAAKACVTQSIVWRNSTTVASWPPAFSIASAFRATRAHSSGCVCPAIVSHCSAEWKCCSLHGFSKASTPPP